MPWKKGLDSRGPGTGIGDLHAELERIEARANRLRVSRQYMNNVYTLREHISLVRERLLRRDG